MMQLMNVSVLKPHPQNEYFFDNITGAKWDEFLESVRTSGIIEPIVVSGDGTIVSGHQRVRACIELGIPTIMTEVRIYDSADKLLKDLIETNVRQRGVIDNTVKIGRIAKELERLYRVGELPREQAQEARAKIRTLCGKQKERLYVAKRLTTLDGRLQSAIETGKIPATVAGEVLTRMSMEEQEKFALALPAIKQWSKRQVEAFAGLIQAKDERLAALEADYSRLESELAAISSADVDKVYELQMEVRKEYERAEGLKASLRRTEERLAAAQESLRSTKYAPAVILTTEGFGIFIGRFMDELEAFKPLLQSVKENRTRGKYYNWLMEMVDAIEQAALICDMDNDKDLPGNWNREAV